MRTKQAGEVWTYEGYWNAVIGAHLTARQAVQELDLLEDGTAEVVKQQIFLLEKEALRQAWIPRPIVWTSYAARAIGELLDAREEMIDEIYDKRDERDSRHDPDRERFCSD